MKAIVITQDKATRIVPTTGEIIQPFRPSVVTVTEFVSTLVMQRLLKPIGFELPDHAMDAEFEKFYNDSKPDADLAISSYLSKFAEEETENERANLREKLAEKEAEKKLEESLKKAPPVPAAAAAPATPPVPAAAAAPATPPATPPAPTQKPAGAN